MDIREILGDAGDAGDAGGPGGADGVADAAGLISARRFRELGVGADQLARLVREGTLQRVHRGLYLPRERWKGLRAGARHRIRVLAASEAARGRLTFSHHSAAALFGLPFVDARLDAVHTHDPGATGGTARSGITVHRSRVAAATESIDGARVTSLARTLVDVATTSSFLTSVVMLDHALRESLARSCGPPRSGPWRWSLTKSSLREELDVVNPRRGGRLARRAIEFADPRSGSPGESLSRVRMHELGFVIPELQVRFPNARGTYFDVDFWWEEPRIIGEFDGRGKYERPNGPDARAPGDIVWDEKLREDELRATAHASFARWPWSVAFAAPVFHRFLAERGVPRAHR
ncbi:type IV toxin-antitoxin system AbiEi family antitoxin domain-containing protein [Compostimonas suwonensis]|uniref:type IV toxin-antitoxin system AbiEi family antitoxin domain-containing protein n=1 Tax=Compostimonas suwonensis TaxID=1048394 RepID=UPI000C246837|nr:type IV toxin-antitoxin system AbiEi family antitoxin domain-containing protein [Compostimonas suwonensis]